MFKFNSIASLQQTTPQQSLVVQADLDAFEKIKIRAKKQLVGSLIGRLVGGLAALGVGVVLLKTGILAPARVVASTCEKQEGFEKTGFGKASVRKTSFVTTISNPQDDDKPKLETPVVGSPQNDKELRAALFGISWKFKNGGKVITFQSNGKMKKSYGRLKPTWKVKGMKILCEGKVFVFNEDFTELSESTGKHFKGVATAVPRPVKVPTESQTPTVAKPEKDAPKLETPVVGNPQNDRELKAALDDISWKFKRSGKVIQFRSDGRMKKSYGRLKPTWKVKDMKILCEGKVFVFNEDFTELSESTGRDLKGIATAVPRPAKVVPKLETPVVGSPQNDKELKLAISDISWEFSDGAVLQFRRDGRLKKSYSLMMPMWKIKDMKILSEGNVFVFNEDFTELSETTGKRRFKGVATAVPRPAKIALPSESERIIARKKIGFPKWTTKIDPSNFKINRMNAGSLLSHGRTVDDDAVFQFVLFEYAKDISVGTGDTIIAIEAIRELEKRVQEFDFWDETVSAIGDSERILERTKNKSLNYEMLIVCRSLVDEAIESDEFQSASKLVSYALNAANRNSDSAAVSYFTTKKNEVDELSKLKKQYDTALVRLGEDPKSPDANDQKGKYLITVNDDLAGALACWAFSNDNELLAIVKGESSSKADPILLAKRWQNLGEDPSTLFGRRCYRRAIDVLHAAGKKHEAVPIEVQLSEFE